MTPRDTGYASGCCMLAAAPMIRQIGALNDAYFLTMEDVEWSYRARLAGWRVLYAPTAGLLHKESMSSRSKGAGMFSPARVYYEHRNTIWFIREYASALQKWGIWPFRLAFHYVFQAGGYVVLRRWQKLHALGRALRDGLLEKPEHFSSQR
jgi:GT2 family glycosyltransferase